MAVYNATKAARKICVNENRPVLIEAMTYRIGHHSTSDDSSAYRSVDEVRFWDSTDHPISRLRHYMVNKGWWDDGKEAQWKQKSKKEVTMWNLWNYEHFQVLLKLQVLESFARAEKKKKPDWRYMFTDVYEKMTPGLESQMKEMEDHLAKYGDHYPLKYFAKKEGPIE